ncbi:MAG: GNAT family N-acetyltransferase, partial [Pseudomonadota bacterium]
MTRFRIAAEDEDWPAIHALVARAFAFMEGRIDPPSSLTRWTAETFREAAAAGPAFLAVDDGRPVGCAFGAVEGEDLHLGKIAVDDACRRGGLARALIDLAAWEARRRGLARLKLQSRVELAENHAAFAALGFERIGETAHPG